jgi:hypothetical protein
LRIETRNQRINNRGREEEGEGSNSKLPSEGVPMITSGPKSSSSGLEREVALLSEKVEMAK